MTTADWPGTLPAAPLRQGLSGQRQDNKLSFQPEVGDAKTRRRFTGTLKDFQASFVMNATQQAAFDTFHDTTLVEGVLPFTWTDPLNGATGTFRFVSPPQWSSPTYAVFQAVCQIRRIS